MVDCPREQELVKSALRRNDIDWNDLKRCCDQIILFGSSTLTSFRSPSDIDLLCVGEGARLKRREVDLVWISMPAIRSQAWLGSELANHVARFGIWLHGSDDWSHRVFVSARAINRKHRSIIARRRGLERLWRTLRSEYREKHLLKLRRDIQRLWMLNASTPVEPAPLLDRRWQEECRGASDLRVLLGHRYAGILPRNELRSIGELLGRRRKS